MVNRNLLASCALALAAVASAPAHAAGTASGTVITLSASIDYKVGTTDFSAASPDATIKVDRIIRMTFAENATGANRSAVFPGTKALVPMVLTNTSNATLDFQLSIQTADSLPQAIYLDNGDGAFNIANDTIITFLDNVPPDGARLIWATTTPPATAANASTYEMTMKATAFEPGAANTFSNVALVNSTTANSEDVDTVLGEAASSTAIDPAGDGTSIENRQVTIRTIPLTRVRGTRLLSDPTNGTTNPALIPGAEVELCVGYQSPTGEPTISNLTIALTIPTDLELVTAYGVKDGVYDPVTKLCTAGTVTGTIADGKATIVIPSLAAGEARTIMMKAKVK